MYTKSLLAASLLLIASITAVTPASAGDECQDESYWTVNDDLYCKFSCEENDTVSVTVNGPNGSWGSAECASASAGCDVEAEGACNDLGIDTATSASSDGECRGWANDGDIICTSQAGAHNLLLALIITVLREMIMAGGTCEQVSTFALSSGFSAFTFKEFAGGELVSEKSWNGAIGCGLLG